MHKVELVRRDDNLSVWNISMKKSHMEDIINAEN